MATPPETKTLEAKCSCGAVHFTVDVPISALPLRVHLCHCSTCRYGSGAPCIFHTGLPKKAPPKFVAPSSRDNITKYPLSDRVTWDFCSTCGAHVATAGIASGIWTVTPSLFRNSGPEDFVINRHIYECSAKDRGIAKFLKGFDGWNPPSDSLKAQLVECEPETGTDGKERLRAKCQCGGVSFTIPRPTPEMAKDEALSQWISPVDHTKWHGTLDLCDDCRLVNGTNLIGWTFIPRDVIEPSIGPDLLIGSAKAYKTSPDVVRTFCGTCGATVFYSHTDRQPPDGAHVVDVATGILRAPEGVMAENWLTWRSRMSFADSGKRFDAAFSTALEESMKQWVLEKEGKLLEYEIG